MHAFTGYSERFPAGRQNGDAWCAAENRRRQAGSLADVYGLIRDHDLPRECVPTDYLNDPAPFLALVEGERVALVNKRHVQRVTIR